MAGPTIDARGKLYGSLIVWFVIGCTALIVYYGSSTPFGHPNTTKDVLFFCIRTALMSLMVGPFIVTRYRDLRFWESAKLALAATLTVFACVTAVGSVLLLEWPSGRAVGFVKYNLPSVSFMLPLLFIIVQDKLIERRTVRARHLQS